MASKNTWEVTGRVQKLWQRIRILVTGNVEWTDEDDGSVEKEKLSWRMRWAIFGIHSYKWGWLRRLGQQPCGCTINPLTRREILTDSSCKVHGGWGD